MNQEDPQDAEKRKMKADFGRTLGGGGPWEAGRTPADLAMALYDAAVLELSWPGFGERYAEILSKHPAEKARVARGLRAVCDALRPE